MSAPCAFCDILAGRAPAARIFEDDRVVAIADRRQTLPGHTLILPRRHAATIYDLDADSAAALMQAAVRIARAVRDTFVPAGLSLWQSNGAAAFQEVPHVHLHLHPRAVDDELIRIYPELPDDTPPAELDALAAKIRSRLY
jgi:histidine triad (HIT) family protein